MGQPITYGKRFFSADGTEINIVADPSNFEDADYLHRTKGGFSAVIVTVGRFVGQVNARAVDAAGTQVDVQAASSDGSTSTRLLLGADGDRRIAALTVNYSPANSAFEFFPVEFWKPGYTEPTEVSSSLGVVYQNPDVVYPWVTKEAVGHLNFRTDTFYQLSITGPAQGVAGHLLFTPTLDRLDGDLPTTPAAARPLSPSAVLQNFTCQVLRDDGVTYDTVTLTQNVSLDFYSGAATSTLVPLPAGWTVAQWTDQSYSKNYSFVLGTSTGSPPDTGDSGSGTLTGYLDSRTGLGSGVLRGFQSTGRQQIVRDSGRTTALS